MDHPQGEWWPGWKNVLSDSFKPPFFLFAPVQLYRYGVANQPSGMGVEGCNCCYMEEMLSEDSITVGIVEDSPDTRQAITFIVHTSPGLKCIAACGTAEEALRSFSSLRPNVVLCDINLPGMSGIELVARMHSILPETQFLMLTVLEDYETIFAALRAGATGYLVKSTPPGKLLEAIHEIFAGGSPMSSQVARQVIAAWKAAAEPKSVSHEPIEKFSHPDLSERECEVLRLISRGFLYKEVADTLGISQGTVRTHIQRIYRKLQVRSKIEAMRKLKI